MAGTPRPILALPRHRRRFRWPVLRGLFRLRARGVEYLPATAVRARRQPHVELRPVAARASRCSRAASCASWPSRSSSGSRSASSSAAGGAFPVRRGEGTGGDRDRRSALPGRGTWSSCSPRHQAEKGHAQEARGRCTRARRGSRSRPACRSFLRRSRGTDRLAGSAPARRATATPVQLDDSTGSRRDGEATERLRTAIESSRSRFGDSPAARVDGDSFAHRAYHAIPKTITARNGRPATCSSGSPNPAPAVAGGAAARGPRRLGHARCADLPPPGLCSLSGRTPVRSRDR